MNLCRMIFNTEANWYECLDCGATQSFPTPQKCGQSAACRYRQRDEVIPGDNFHCGCLSIAVWQCDKYNEVVTLHSIENETRRVLRGQKSQYKGRTCFNCKEVSKDGTDTPQNLLSGLTSVLIPSCREPYLQQTIDDVLKNAIGDVEVVVALDGYWPSPQLKSDDRVRVVHWSEPRGMRHAINAAASVASGEWLMKCDAHCAFGDGWDNVLKDGCDDSTVAIPRRYDLAPEPWLVTDKTPIDYHYISFPDDKTPYLKGRVWKERATDRADVEIDDEMTTQGSCWFMSRSHWDKIGGLDEALFGQFGQEAQEIGNKTWLSGGRMVVNKRTWYAHWSKPSRSWTGQNRAREVSRNYWMTDSWEGQVKPLSWLIAKFWPVPGWPRDWRNKRAR